MFAVGLLLIALSLSLESLCRLIQRRVSKLQYPLAEWNSNSCLQLQRLAFEELGTGQWKGCDQYVPFTEEHTDVEPLDLSEPKHPIRSRPPELSDDTPKTERSESILDVQAISTVECASSSGGGPLGRFAWERQSARSDIVSETPSKDAYGNTFPRHGQNIQPLYTRRTL